MGAGLKGGDVVHAFKAGEQIPEGADHVMVVELDDGIFSAHFKCLVEDKPFGQRSCQMVEDEGSDVEEPGCGVLNWFDALGMEFLELNVHGRFEITNPTYLKVTSFSWFELELEHVPSRP